MRERLGQLLFVSGVLATVEIFLLTVRANLVVGIYTALCFYGMYFQRQILILLLSAQQ